MNKKGNFNLQLESLRGICALFVVIAHLIGHSKEFNQSYFPYYLRLVFNSDTAHLAVLIFFILSGFVIGASNNKKLEFGKVWLYLKKRFVRLYPIYIISIVFALVIAGNHYSKATIFCNLTFLQGLFSNVIWENNPIWSLNYEVLYYLLFIPISLLNLDPIIVFVSSILIALLNNHLLPNLPILTSYFVGYSFWAIGLVISKYFNNRESGTEPNKLLGTMFFIMALTSLLYNCQLVKRAFLFLDVFNNFPTTSNWASTSIPFHDYIYIPFCFCIIMIFSGNKLPYKNVLLILIQIPLFFGVYHIVKYNTHDKSLIVSIIYYVIAIMFYVVKLKFANKISGLIVNWGIGLGSISYGVYVIHYPILYSFGRLGSTNSSLFYLMKVVIFMIVVLAVGFFLEKKYQTWIKSLAFPVNMANDKIKN